MNNTKTLSTDTFRFKPIKDYQSEYFNKTHVNYNYSLNGSFISATLYKLDVKNSSVSDGAETKLEMIGKNSPYRYNEIVGIPLFNVNQVDIQLGWSEENGYTSEINLECVVPPSELCIDIDDYILLDYSSYSGLWRVVEAHPDTFEEIYYNRIILKPTRYSRENISFQVLGRYSYMFESGAVLDKGVNDTLNDILKLLSNLYSEFLPQFYAKQGIVIDLSLLDSFPSKFFKFEDLPIDSHVFSYFFKKFIATSLITIHINHHEKVEKFFKFKSLEDAMICLYSNSAKFLYKFMHELENNKNYIEALNNTIIYIEEMRLKLTKENIDIAMLTLLEPYKSFIELDWDFFRTFLDTSKMMVEVEHISKVEKTKTLKIFSNLKKLIKKARESNDNETILKYLLLFSLFKAIPFKNINFGVSSMTYCE